MLEKLKKIGFKKPKFFLLFVVAIVALGGFIVFVNQYLVGSRAAGERAHIVLDPKQAVWGKNQTKTVTVRIDPQANGLKFSGFDLTFNVSGPITLTSVGQPTALGDSTVVFTKIIQTNNRVSYVVQNDPLPISISIPFTFQTGNADGNATFSFDKNNSQIIGNISGYQYTIDGVDQGTYTIGNAPTATVGPTVTTGQPTSPPAAGGCWRRADGSAPTSQTTNCRKRVFPQPLCEGRRLGFALCEQCSPDGSGICQELFTKSVVNYLSADTCRTVESCTDENVCRNKNQTGLNTDVYEYRQDLVWQSVCGSPNPTNRPSATGAPTSSPNATNTPTTQPNATNTQAPTQNPSATGAPTSAGGSQVTANLQLKFQGITSKVNSSMKVKVIARTATGNRTSEGEGTFTSADNGVWTGTVTLQNIDLTRDYYLLIKGPKHVQKRVCVATPSETSIGSYKCNGADIRFTAGTNNLNLSGITLMSGDLATQDGVVDSYDLSYIINNLGSTDPTVLEIGDVNLNGRVDTQDYSLIIQSLTIKSDEE